MRRSTQPDGAANRAIASRSEGIDHIAFEVEDIEEAIGELLSKGVPVVDLTPRTGAEGSRVALLDVRGTHGVTVELVERARKESGLDRATR